jgi:hypothetical protein
MIEVKEPYSGLPVTIEDNEYFIRNREYVIELHSDGKGIVAITVNNRKLQPHEWKLKEGVHYITLKDWA